MLRHGELRRIRPTTSVADIQESLRAIADTRRCHNEADRCTALPFQDTSLGPAPEIMITGERPNGLAACISCEYRCAIGLAECVAGFRFRSHSRDPLSQGIP